MVMTIAEMIAAVTDMMADTGLLPIAFMMAVVGGAMLLLRRAIKAAK